jgi:GNAT superfamily N-acetyltransferase
MTTATRTYLEMRTPAALVPSLVADRRLDVVRVTECPASFYRYLYSEVGSAYRWVDRAAWNDDRVRAHLARPDVTLWVMWCGGVPAGYFELEHHADGSIEIAYFGLIPEFVGRGLGRHLLSVATTRAWEAGANRVWLHTSSLDHPAALGNYLSRGFEIVRSESYEAPDPAACPDGDAS